MRPLQAKAQFHALSHGQFKVAGLAEFAQGAYALPDMILDLRDPDLPDLKAMQSLPWGGFLVAHPEAAPAQRPWLWCEGPAEWIGVGDVVELLPSIAKVALRYRRGDNGNVLFATEQCNSYCLMCSQPPRVIDDAWRLGQLHHLVDLIDKEESSLAISGGEPMLLGMGLAELVKHCAEALPATHLHILSNGRLAGEGDYASAFKYLHPALTWGIPLYGDTPVLHDYVVQRSGAFAQTLRGLYALEQAQQRIEIRIVLVAPVASRLEAIARFIYRNLPFVEHIALMGVEPTGFAKANRDALWIDPLDMVQVLERSVQFLFERNLTVSLYNLPLCTLPRSLWAFAHRSISHWKQTYRPECNDCTVRERCGGFFSWINDEWLSRGIAPIYAMEQLR